MLRHCGLPSFLFATNQKNRKEFFENVMNVKKYSKKEAIKIVSECAKKYQEYLEEKVLLIVYQNTNTKDVGCIELHFHARNFLHLTGFKLREKFLTENEADSRAKNFYKKCLDHKLSTEDFDFSTDGTTHLKLMILPSLLCPNLNAKMIGKFSNGKPKLFTDRLAGNTKGAIGFIKDKTTHTFLPNTVVSEDVRNLIDPVDRVIAIFIKNEGDIKFLKPTYIAKKVDWDDIKIDEKYVYLLELCEAN